MDREDWPTILQAYARCARILRGLEERFEIDEARFVEEEERALHAALKKAESKRRAPGSVDDFLKAFEPMIPAVTVFFDEVLVMSEDQELQNNRLAMLQRIVELAEGVVDLSCLEGF